MVNFEHSSLYYSFDINTLSAFREWKIRIKEALRLHSMYGFPSEPGRQEHVGWWCAAVQMALGAQVSSWQTGLHFRLRRSQASWSAQSSLYWQITPMQDNSGFPWVPRGQTHCGWWPCTWHSAPLPQEVCKQGFTQLLFMQALSYWQSLSCLHSAGKFETFHALDTV